MIAGEAAVTSSFKKGWNNFHYWATGLLVLFLFPLLKRLHLPTNFDWVRLIFTFWVLLAARSIFVAVLLYLIGNSAKESLGPLLQRGKARLFLILPYFAVLCWWLTWPQAFVLTVDTVAILELRERFKPGGLRRTVSATLMPALYLFLGLLLVSAYNDIIVSCRFFAAADPTFDAMDKWLLHGRSVPLLCHWALRTFPILFFRFLEFIYYGMFALLGAALILVAQRFGRGRALQFVGAVLVGYCLALVLFYFWPSQGPYYLCPTHFSEFPSTLRTYAAQKGSWLAAQARWNHQPLHQISFDYFIAFPCMHIVQPLVATWFLRSWRRLIPTLAIYNGLLLVAIVLLEWHYLVDVFAGVIVAALAIASVDGLEFWRTRAPSGIEVGSCAISP